MPEPAAVLVFEVDFESEAEAAVARWWRRHRKQGVRRLAHEERAQGAWHRWTLRVPTRLVGELRDLLAQHEVSCAGG